MGRAPEWNTESRKESVNPRMVINVDRQLEQRLRHSRRWPSAGTAPQQRWAPGLRADGVELRGWACGPSVGTVVCAFGRPVLASGPRGVSRHGGCSAKTGMTWLSPSGLQDSLLSLHFASLSLLPLPSPRWFLHRCRGQTPPSLRSHRAFSFPLSFRDVVPDSLLD